MTTLSPNILVVDDDANVRWMLDRYLSKHGFKVTVTEDGSAMREQLKDDHFDLVLLDLSLPGEDGLTLTRYLREHHDLAIIMLTAASEVVDRIVGLEMGADDYVTKPFEPRELVARMRSVLRRSSPAETNDTHSKTGIETLVNFGRFTLNLEAQQLLDGKDHEVAITTMEFDLLKAFSENPDKVLSRDRLLDLAHNRDWDPYDRSIDIRVARLRRKIERDPSKPQVIKTIRGSGYMFVSDVK